MIAREDFQAYFKEWSTGKGPPEVYLVEKILAHHETERGMADLQVLTKWLRYYKILNHVRENRLMDVSQRLKLINCPTTLQIITQGEPGDAFYIVLEGTLSILVDNMIVNTIGMGTSFGEKALENDAPRSAYLFSTIL